jgi:hypothetical protein
MLTGMSHHGRRLWEASLLTGMTRHGCRPWEAYLLPFLCQGRALVEVEAARAPFQDLSSTPKSGSDPRGRARRSPLLEVGRGETRTRGVGRGGTLS